MNLTKFKKLLEEERIKVINEISKIDESVNSLPDYDISEDFEEAEVMNNKLDNFKLKDDLEEVLKDVDLALSKMKKGKYGICENCKNNIELKRLEMYPFARYCMECMSKFEDES